MDGHGTSENQPHVGQTDHKNVRINEKLERIGHY